MYSPSLHGVGPATLVLLWHMVRPVAQNCRCQRVLPSLAFRHTTCSRSWRGPLLQVRNTRSPTTMAPERPRPGRSIAHFRFSLPSLIGSALSLVTPVPPGPRNCSQSPASTAVVNVREMIKANFFMLGSYWFFLRWGTGAELLVPSVGVAGRLVARSAVPVGSHTRI